MSGMNRKLFWGLSIVAVGLAVGVGGGVAAGALAGRSDPSEFEFTDVREQTRQFMQYNKTIELTPEQEAIKRQALEALPAPCCGDRTAHTCCCPCNMAQSWWGLAKHLIAERGYGVEEVRETVSEWFRFINPDGFSGNACYSGGCARPFHENGCGGMNEKQVAF